MAYHNDFGNEAEDLALAFLTNKGYEIITRNYRYLKAEIDIIAKKNNTLCIIEVKARSSGTLIAPEDAVNKKKIRLIISAADAFVQEYEGDYDIRFDIITIISNSNGNFNISHIKDAFDAMDISS